MNLKKPVIIRGDIYIDERGAIHFVNDFDFKEVKRFYQVSNFDTKTIRAFHGHKKESKYLYVVSGSVLVCAVYIDNFKNPSQNTPIERYVLSEKKSQILYIPPHYANGWMALQENTQILFFSTCSLKASLNDDFRYPYNYWGLKIWNITNK